MPWFKVDDALCMHPKVIAAGNSAIGLWVRAGTWSMQQLTDGWIPLDVVRMLGSERDAAKLVAAGLWEAKSDGYAFHEWDQYQPSRVKVMSEREEARERRRIAREKAKSAARNSPEPQW